MELYTQICLLEPKLFQWPSEFGMRYCAGRKMQIAGKTVHDFSGSSHMEELKLLMTERFMIRRLKSNVLSQLPSKLRQMIVLDPSLVQSKSREMQSCQKSYQNAKKNVKDKKGALLEWFHATAPAKSKAVQEYIREMLENGRKFICFAHHNTMMNDIAATIEKGNN